MVTTKRIFKYGSLVLDDPDISFSEEEVREFYSDVYPELTQATIEGPEPSEDGLVYTFVKAVGTKGNTVSLAEIAEGNVPFELKRIEGNIDFSLNDNLVRILSEEDGETILIPSYCIDPIQ